MYAVIKDNGKQYKVKPGDNIWVDLKKDTNSGDTIEFDNVLLYSNDDTVEIGKPLVPDIKVLGEIKGEKKGKKMVVMKFRRRKDSRTKKGHRQHYTEVKIKEIACAGGASATATTETE